jgi:hypothetical protein
MDEPALRAILAKCKEVDALLKGRKIFCCPRCLAESYNPHDIEHRYCGRCHMFIRDPTPLSQSTMHLGDSPPPRPKAHPDAQWIKDGGWSGKR